MRIIICRIFRFKYPPSHIVERSTMQWYICGSALPTVIIVSVIILTLLSGLMFLWEQDTLHCVRMQRLRQAQANVESAYALYRYYSDQLLLSKKILLYDTLPQSQIYIDRKYWGLYEAVYVASADSLVTSCRLWGAEPNGENTLSLMENNSALTLAGNTVLQGRLHIPKKGLVYGRLGAKFYHGRKISDKAILDPIISFPTPTLETKIRIDKLWKGATIDYPTNIPDSLTVSFLSNQKINYRINDTVLRDKTIVGHIVMFADELRIDSTCRWNHPLMVARKITIGDGAHLTGQFFARDTIIVGRRAKLEYPSGLWSNRYIELNDYSVVNGFVIVHDTTVRHIPKPCFMQANTARLRGLLLVDGFAQVQGIIAGGAILKQLVYCSNEGFYKNMLYDCTLLENSVTSHPIGYNGVGTGRKKEIVCLE